MRCWIVTGTRTIKPSTQHFRELHCLPSDSRSGMGSGRKRMSEQPLATLGGICMLR